MLTLPSGIRMPSYSVYFKDGIIRKDMQPREDTRKQNIKEMSQALALVMPPFNQLRNIGQDGKEIPGEAPPSTKSS
jgi:hypothetical protein